MTNKNRIAITLGDPSGIGPEVIIKAIDKLFSNKNNLPIIIGDTKTLEKTSQKLSLDFKFEIIENLSTYDDNGKIKVLDNQKYSNIDFPLGENSLDSGKASHEWVELATDLAISKDVDAICTAPINKESWQMSGFKDIGHQEIFKRKSKASYVATMLVSGKLRCMHLSTHLSLSEACKYVTKENVERAIKLTHDHFTRWGFDSPKIGVAALNPHASDGGLIGNTEEEEILPAVKACKQEGIKVSGPHPADSIFYDAINDRHDVVVVMYHDQGHIPIKVYGFEESISVNLGVPFIRTSVDHGTAFDIAGKNIADPTSMIEAIKLAQNLSKNSKL
ncbi:MAG: 4-hydroxythreonine-4-phosphate dehydrogenase PdxA [Chloroflexi bacterium]|nr:4-hydroxythreonine-4-phosphate dehydrogenase PdxA [Chloroflexota bacterium]|tara:strand:- start:136651 stop:137649 length:999 start_codon:yes stop_codon:yes gene_type:complete